MAAKRHLPARRDIHPSLRRHDLSHLVALQHNLNRWFNELWDGFGARRFGALEKDAAAFNPSVDVSETPRAIRVKAELPGLDPKDLSLTLEHDVLMIRGEKKEERRDVKANHYRQECSYGSFMRVVPLAARVNPAKARATFTCGVLAIELPKLKTVTRAKPVRLAIGRG